VTFILLIICLNLLILTNVGWAARYKLNPVVKTEVKEIEVIKRAVCECEHISSNHKNGTGSCQALTFYTDEGKVKLSRSIECPCTKYTGPVPLSEYFDDQIKELESKRV
jgi:hypothetical protein